MKPPLLLWHKMLLLLGSVIFVMLIGMAVLAWYSLAHVSDEIEAYGEEVLAFQAQHFLEKIVKGQAATIDISLEKAKAFAVHGAVLLSESHPRAPRGSKAILELLKNLTRRESHVAATYFAPLQGEMMVYPPSGDLSGLGSGMDFISLPHFPHFADRDIHLGAVKLGQAHSNPFSFKHDLLVDAVSPVMVEGQLQGYVGVSLSVPQLIAQFNQLQPIRGSYAFLSDSNQMLVFGPPHARVDLAPSDPHHPSHRIHLRDPENPELSMALNHMAMGHASLDQVPIKGSLKYFGYHPLRSIDWRFGFVMPVSMATSASRHLAAEVTHAGDKAVKIMLVWAFTLFIFAIFLGLFMVERLVAPIQAMIGVTRSMAAGDLAQRVAVTSRDEMGQLAADFNTMADRVETMVAHLEDLNLHLQAQNEHLQREMDVRKAVEERLVREHEKRKRLSKELIDLLERDRRRIAMELHDDIGQTLTALKMDLEWPLEHHRSLDPDIRKRFETAQEKAVNAIRGVKEIAYTLRPSMLDNLGLEASLENLIHGFQESFHVNIHFFSRGIPQKLNLEKLTALYRVAQEAIWNALKHSQATNIFVNLTLRGKTISLGIEDDGVGFDFEAATRELDTRGKMGLRIIEERILQVSGEITWESREGGGTHLLVEIPI